MAKRKATTRPSRAKQGFLPEMEPPSHKDVDAAADNYYEVMMERTRLSKEEDEKKTYLIEKMREHGIERYVTPDGLVVTVSSKSNVAVKRKGRKDDDE